MRLLILLLSLLLQCYSSLAQVYFSQPTSEEVIMGGVPFIVTVYESLTAPYFSQMTDFNLLLYSGNNSSPMNLYSWYLNGTNPSIVSNCIIFPPSVGPNASDAYFLGIRGTLKSNTSIYATYYSTRFTLTNMTGTQPLDAYTAGALYTGLTSAPSLLVTCGEPIGVSCDPPELKALSTGLPTYATVSAGLGLAAPLVTSPPVGTAYATSTLTASYKPTVTVAGVEPAITAIITPAGASPTSTSPGASTSSAAATTTSKMLPAMVYPVIISGISLTAVCVLFYIYSRYKRTRHPHYGKRHCEKLGMKRERTWWDRIPMPRAIRRSRAIELDAEKAAVELEGERRREELDSEEKKVRFELEGELGSIKKVVNIVVRSERIGAPSGGSEQRQWEGVAGRVGETVPRAEEESIPRNEATKVVGKAIPVKALKRDLPPLPTDQGKPGCGEEKTSACETMRETHEREKKKAWKARYSVGPDGSYNYR